MVRKYTKNHLLRLRDTVNDLQPGTEIDERIIEWGEISDDELRTASVSAFFNMNGISPEKVKRINGNTFKRIIPWRRLGIGFSLLVVASFIFFVSVRIYQYAKLKVIYTYGNNVPIYADKNSSVTLSNFSLFGYTYDSVAKKTNKKLLLIGSVDNVFEVKKPGFVRWFFNRSPDGVLKNTNLVLDKQQYDQYEQIFESLKKDPEIVKLTDEARWIIWKSVTDPASPIVGAVVANRFPTAKAIGNYTKVASFKHGGITYVCIPLEKNGFGNYLLTSDLNKKPGKLTTGGKEIDEPILFNILPAINSSTPPNINIRTQSNIIYYSTGHPDFFQFLKQ